MYFDTKSYLKSTHNHTAKHTRSGVKIQSKDRNGKRIVKEFKFEEEGNVLKLSSGEKDNHYY
jgi:hypothetical protein